MDWKSHLVIGILFGLAISALALHQGAQGVFLFSAISGAAALLPDLDTRKSKASQMAYAAGLVAIAACALLLSSSQGFSLQLFLLYAVLFLFAALALDALLRPRHRGCMHSLAFLLALSAASFALFGAFSASAIAAGYFSHLAADLCLKPA